MPYHFRDVAPAESARRKSVMLCQRFERRMRQCGAFELRISTRVARPNHFNADRDVPAAFKSLDIESQKNYLRVVALNVLRSSQNANSAMTVLFFPVAEREIERNRSRQPSVSVVVAVRLRELAKVAAGKELHPHAGEQL